MSNTISMVDLVNLNMDTIRNAGVGQLQAEYQKLAGTTIEINGKITHHFGSCSYLNLETDHRLKNAAIKAIQEYGIQFSTSRAYLSVPLYSELEDLLSKIFNHPTIITPTSTLGHIANIPILVQKNDAIILDHQVHNSVQNASQIAKANGSHLEMVRHNNLEYLERRILKLKDTKEKIWYMADGIYSMYGDECPIKDLVLLLEKYEQFHIYIDDAHGMSWTGKNGVGYILDQVDLHPKMILVTSFCKGFGASGGATIFPNQKIAKRIRNCGSTHIFSSPLQPTILAAAIASAKIHLSSEIIGYQNQLKENILFFKSICKKLSLPLVSPAMTPIQYIGAGQPEMALQVCQRLLQKGYYTCVAGYPSVPYKNCGIRMTINRLHTKAQIEGLINSISEILNEVLIEFNYSQDEILKAFKK